MERCLELPPVAAYGALHTHPLGPDVCFAPSPIRLLTFPRHPYAPSDISLSSSCHRHLIRKQYTITSDSHDRHSIISTTTVTRLRICDATRRLIARQPPPRPCIRSCSFSSCKVAAAQPIAVDCSPQKPFAALHQPETPPSPPTRPTNPPASPYPTLFLCCAAFFLTSDTHTTHRVRGGSSLLGRS